MHVMMDAWWCLPTRAKVKARARKDRTEEKEALQALLKEREELITQSKDDPYRYVTEPDIWLVCDAILDFPWCSDITRARLLQRMQGFDWREPLTWESVWGVFKRAMRKKLGMKQPRRHLLISGTNRSSKSNYCVSRAVRLAVEYDWRAMGEDDVRVYFMHETAKRVREDQMTLIFKYLPKELRQEAIKEDGTYISYKPATGFSNDTYVTPNGVRTFFRSYEQEMDKALEGLTAKMIVAEENMPLKWADRAFTRLSDKNGWYLQPFTPIHGWTATVGLFQAGMTVVRDIPAYVLPADLGKPDIAAAVGLTQAEFEHVQKCKWADPPEQPQCPRSRPEDCLAWLWEGTGEKCGTPGTSPGGTREGTGTPGTSPGGTREGTGTPGTSPGGTREGTGTPGTSPGGTREGRRWERVPRVARCVDERKAVVWFSPMDNPYSDAADVIANNLPRGRDEVLKCVYGVAVKSFSAKFARFSRDVHVVPEERIPREGLNGLVIDPAGTRNWAMLWYRWDARTDAIWIYREFPSSSRLTPGVGVMGPWAESDDRNGGVNDGRKGAGQEPLGWSYLRYKAEIARLERWNDWLEWEERAKAEPERYWNGTTLCPLDSEVEAWDEDNGSEERTDKIGDVRALSTPKQEKDRFETMQTILDDCGLRLDFADGVEIEDGVAEINHRLDFEKCVTPGTSPGGTRMGEWTGERIGEVALYVRAPKIYVSEACANVIMALEGWQNADGLKGAYKDFVDLVRYAVLRVKRQEFRRRGVTVASRRAGRAGMPGVGRELSAPRLEREHEKQWERRAGAGGRCVMRMRRR